MNKILPINSMMMATNIRHLMMENLQRANNVNMTIPK